MNEKRNILRCLLALTILATFANPHGIFADDWPMFGRDRTHNAVSPENVEPLTDWDVGKYDEKADQWNGSRNILWAARLGTQTFGDPVVSNGQVWIGINNFQRRELNWKDDASVLAGFAAIDGKPVYRYVSHRLPQGHDFDWPSSALACSPLIEGERMWFVTNRGETVCLDLGPLMRGETQPRDVWKVDMIQKFAVSPAGSRMAMSHFCSITSYKDFIYVITGNSVNWLSNKIPSPEAPSAICFNKNTGEVVWQDNSPGANILDGQSSSPLVIETGDGAQVVMPQGDGWLRSFEALTGRLIWKFDINFKTSKWLFGGRSTRNIIMATPVFYEGRVYVASGQYELNGDGPGRLVCIDPTKAGDISGELAEDADGHPLSEGRYQSVDTTKGQRAVPNPNSGLVWDYIGSNRNADRKIGFEGTFHRTFANVTIKDNFLVAADGIGLIHCLDARTGQKHWAYDSFAWIFATPLIVGAKVYVANEDGKIQIFRLSPEPHDPIVENEMDGGPIYTSPIFANGVLYAATRSWLFAIAETPQ